LIDKLDLVVSVDTAVAHLAGAMGQKVWTLARFNSVWPWFRDYDTTPWYGDMRLYRQARLFDWSGPLGRLAVDLEELIKTRKAAA
jgi:ADP-heptose:LPS heptosyltransferase